MGGYREALTRLFLTGAFPRRSEPASARPRARPAFRRSASRTPLAPMPRRRPTLMGEKMTHPGEILARYLGELGLTASDLARDIDVPVNRVTGIINGQRGVTADTALRLGHWFGVAPEDWLDLQAQYELAQARRDVGAKVKGLPRLADRAV